MPSRARSGDAAGDPFEALGDPHRRQILSTLRQGPQSVQEIADRLPISRPAVSRHLRLLREAGLVSRQQQGTRGIYTLENEGVQAIRAYLERVWGEAAARFGLVAQNTRPRGRRR